jgi:hypothetical protein
MTNGACHQSRTDYQDDHHSQSCNRNQVVVCLQPLQNWLHSPSFLNGSAEPLPQQDKPLLELTNHPLLFPTFQPEGDEANQRVGAWPFLVWTSRGSSLKRLWLASTYRIAILNGAVWYMFPELYQKISLLMKRCFCFVSACQNGCNTRSGFVVSPQTAQTMSADVIAAD